MSGEEVLVQKAKQVDGEEDGKVSSRPDPEPLLRGVKRPWEYAQEVDGNKKLALEEETADEIKKERIKLKKYVLLLSYLGQGYLGMQRNPGTKTIEEDLLMALKKAELISEEAFETPQFIQFQRAARTDKGVSAARQIVNLKLPVADDLVEKINKHLPEVICVQAAKQVTKRFNSKTFCSARTYSYTMPTFALAPTEALTSREYRITPEVLQEVNQILAKFKGTHNFHNYTAKRKPMDPSAQRYIMNMECGPAFEQDGLELVRLEVKGQSFMLHQIRKMVGVAMAVARGLASEEVVERAWGEERLDIPIAPGLGLVLEEVHYDKYNLRFGNDGLHLPLTWDGVDNQVQEFVKQFILPAVVRGEKEENSMLKWLETLPYHSFDVRTEEGASELTALGKAARRVEAENNRTAESEESQGEESDGPQETIKT